MKLKPNFLIVGAAKAGTTSLAKYLGEHPDIFIPKEKEPRFFIKDSIAKISNQDPLRDHILKTSILNEKKYYNLYDVKEKLKGDASVHYLYHYEEVIPKVKESLGDVPIIIMIRNPIDRLVSNFKYLIKYIPYGIDEAIKNEHTKKNKNFNSFWFFRELGLYSEPISAYKNSFRKVKIIIFEEFIKKPEIIYNECVEWLGLPYVELKNIKKHNQSVEVNATYKFLQRIKIIYFFKFFKKTKVGVFFKKIKLNFFSNKIVFEIDEKLRKELIEFYKLDVAKLKTELKLDLKCWDDDF